MALLTPDIMSATSVYIQCDEHSTNDLDLRRHFFLQRPTLDAVNGLSPSTTLQESQRLSNESQSQSQLQLQSQLQPQFPSQPQPEAEPEPISTFEQQQQEEERKQRALLLKAAREQYTLVTDHEIPSISHNGEILIKVTAIGLNPIDWKAPYVPYALLLFIP